MRFEIGKGGIAFIDFNIGLDSNSTTITMTQPWKETNEFYEERERIRRIFKANSSYFNSVEVNHEGYSEQTIIKFKKVVRTLSKELIIDLQSHNEMIKKLEEMVAQVKLESEQETAQFALLLADFKTNIEGPYKNLKISRSSDLMTDESINPLPDLIYQVCRYRGNPMKVGANWVFLLLCEGGLEKLIESLDTKELNEFKEQAQALRCGITSFLQRYEKELQAVIDKTIAKSASWFQRLYANYKSMVETGKSPDKKCYGPLGVKIYQLYLPARFVK